MRTLAVLPLLILFQSSRSQVEVHTSQPADELSPATAELPQTVTTAAVGLHDAAALPQSSSEGRVAVKASRRRRRRSSTRRRRRRSSRRRKTTPAPTPPPERGRRRRRTGKTPPDTGRRRSKPGGGGGPKPKCWKPTPKDANPFVKQTYYVNPSYRESLATSIKTAEGKIKETLQKMQNVPSAFWIDVKSKVYKQNSAFPETPGGHSHTDMNTVEGILEDAAKCDPPHLVVLMVYDLPNRDCFALASNGEICCHYGGDKGRTKCEFNEKGFYKYHPAAKCKDGLKEYQETYIDPFVKVVKSFDGRVPIVLVIEPDSLPNMITNMEDSREDFRGCNPESQTSYMDGISYAVNKFADTEASMYLDAGHGGWLGWANPEDDKPKKFMSLISQMGIHTKMRGFATNVAGYQAVGELRCPELGACKGYFGRDEPCCQFDPCGLREHWNWGHTELNFVDVMADRAKSVMPGFDPRFIVDTGRNGKPDARTSCKNWCNPRGNGIGHVPTPATGHPRIDAYYWLKTPGESDGCTETVPDGGKCARFDEMCASADSIGSKAGEPRSPEAGLWFDFEIKDLAANANLGDPWWVGMYDKGLQCRGSDGGCADPMPQPPKTTPAPLPPGKCGGNDGRCNGPKDAAACYKASNGCKWSGCCGGDACAPKDHNGWACPGKDASSCKSDSKCLWQPNLPR